MSLKSLETLNNNVTNIIILVQSASMQYYVKNKIKETFQGHRDFITEVTTQKQLNDAKLDSYVAPMFCDKWLIHVDADKLSLKDTIAGLDRNTHHGITIYWTEKWATFNKLKSLDIVEKQGSHCPVFRFTRLSFYEILDLMHELVPENKRLTRDLEVFVAKGYQFDIQSVMDLISWLRSGNTFDTKREIIEQIGVGGNSVANLLIRILMSSPDTERKRKRNVSDIIKLMEDLSFTYNHSTIRRFMLSNLEGCIEIKQLQIMGIYNKPNMEIPETYDAKRISMMRRFEKLILNDITLPQLLNLKLSLLHYNDFDSEVSLIQAIVAYFSQFEVEPEKPKQEKEKKPKKRKNKTKAEKEKEIQETLDNITSERILINTGEKPQKLKLNIQPTDKLPKQEMLKLLEQRKQEEKEKQTTQVESQSTKATQGSTGVKTFNLAGLGNAKFIIPTKEE